MNQILSDALAEELATLPRLPVPALGDPNYGRDLDCVTDCTDDFREISGDSPRIIAQALARRFQTPRGSLLDDLDYGLDLRGKANHGITQLELRALQTQAIGECKKDQRVERVTLTLTYALSVLTVSGIITPRDPRLEPFPMVLTITDVVRLNG